MMTSLAHGVSHALMLVLVSGLFSSVDAAPRKAVNARADMPNVALYSETQVQHGGPRGAGRLQHRPWRARSRADSPRPRR